MEPTTPTDTTATATSASASTRRPARSRWFAAGAASVLLGLGGLAVSAGALDGGAEKGGPTVEHIVQAPDGAGGGAGTFEVCAAVPLDELPDLGTLEAAEQVAAPADGEVRSGVVTVGRVAVPLPADAEPELAIVADGSCEVLGPDGQRTAVASSSTEPASGTAAVDVDAARP